MDDPEDGLAGLKALPAEEKIFLYESIASQKEYASKRYLEMLNEALDADEALQEQKAAYEAEMDAKQDSFVNRPDVKEKLAEMKAKFPLILDSDEKKVALQEIVTAYSEHLGFDKETTVKLVEKKPENGGSYIHDENGGVYTLNTKSFNFDNFDKVVNTTFHEMRHRLQAEKQDAAIANRENDSTSLVTRMHAANFNAYVSDDYGLYAAQKIEEDARHAGERAEKFVAGLDATPNISAVPAAQKWDSFAVAADYLFDGARRA
ncbi:MAG: hypothetical protein GY804_13015 [Alphaproteobacteria bacterium]|nr:hypothetical protein [Alphaproteobacteria bacterium]